MFLFSLFEERPWISHIESCKIVVNYFWYSSFYQCNCTHMCVCVSVCGVILSTIHIWIIRSISVSTFITRIDRPQFSKRKSLFRNWCCSTSAKIFNISENPIRRMCSRKKGAANFYSSEYNGKPRFLIRNGITFEVWFPKKYIRLFFLSSK